jgi:uncharacterized membrane protein
MNAIMDINEIKQNLTDAIRKAEECVKVCNEKIKHLTNPQKYGCCISRYNSIVINKERMMVVTTKDGKTHYAFAPTYPTYFTPQTAKKIVANDIFKDGLGNRIELTIVGELEYYQLLKKNKENGIQTLTDVLSNCPSN